MVPSRTDPSLPAALSRVRRGRWLGGVCAGAAQARGLPVRWVRLGFVAATALVGFGLLVYAACWLIIPAEGEEPGAEPSRGVVLLAQGLAAVAGLATLGAGAAAATIFGFGWAVLAVAATILVLALATWPRVGPAGTLLPIIALALPAVAVAVADVRIAAQAGSIHEAPRTVDDLPGDGYRSGLGTLFIDLRDTKLPRSGTVPLRIGAGIRRTIVALPNDRCLPVTVRWRIQPFAARLASAVARRGDDPYSAVALFGRRVWAGQGTARVKASAAAAGPTLAISFASRGGSLTVRDYPDNIDPRDQPDWPGYRVHVEPRPDTRGVPKRAARRLVRHWRVRRREQERDARWVNARMGGPCAAGQEHSR